MKIIHIDIPEYTKEENLNLTTVASKIDAALLTQFPGEKVVLRTLSSEDHGILKDELVRTISELGTDRYNPTREGDRYNNIEAKQIDLFGRICTIKPGNLMSKSLIEGFHIYGAQFHGRPSSKMDIWLIYDRAQLRAVSYTQSQSKSLKRDGYIFKNINDKKSALLGIIVIS
ncbi:MAG: hypothetical protein QG628_1015 [Patescibacteria group bacterium]|nr:hypothetical protein [Patescibacteria group bacterium]